MEEDGKERGTKNVRKGRKGDYVGGREGVGVNDEMMLYLLMMSLCSTAVFVLDCHIHIGRRPWPYVYLLYGKFFAADASNLLIPINGLVHVGLKPSIYGRAARL